MVPGTPPPTELDTAAPGPWTARYELSDSASGPERSWSPSWELDGGTAAAVGHERSVSQSSELDGGAPTAGGKAKRKVVGSGDVRSTLRSELDGGGTDAGGTQGGRTEG